LLQGRSSEYSISSTTLQLPIGQKTTHAFPSRFSFGTKASSMPLLHPSDIGFLKQLLESVLEFLLSPITKYSFSGTWKIVDPFEKVTVFLLFEALRYVSSIFVPVGLSWFVT